MYGISVAGIACSCYSCRGYSAYIPEGNIEFAKHYLRKRCPLCGAELVIEQVEYRGY